MNSSLDYHMTENGHLQSQAGYGGEGNTIHSPPIILRCILYDRYLLMSLYFSKKTQLHTYSRVHIVCQKRESYMLSHMALS